MKHILSKIGMFSICTLCIQQNVFVQKTYSGLTWTVNNMFLYKFHDPEEPRLPRCEGFVGTPTRFWFN